MLVWIDCGVILLLEKTYHMMVVELILLEEQIKAIMA